MRALELLDRVENIIQTRSLLPPDEGLVVGVSGGLDSVVLLDLLHRLAPAHGWSLVVAHFNHQLRGIESDGDQAFVEQLARTLNLPVACGSGDVRSHARRKGLSIEMAARERRHAFLASVARQHGCSSIALAHHADDQIETCFLRLLRGTGPDGLGGMSELSHSPADKRLRLARPLLEVPKADLDAYALERGLQHREDASNTVTDPLRNRVRHELVPLLEQRFQPALHETIRRTMTLVRDAANLVAEAARQWEQSEPKVDFAALNTAVQRRVLHDQLLEAGVAPTFDLIERLRTSTKVVTVAPGIRVRRDDRGMLVRDRVKARASIAFRTEELRVPIVGSRGCMTFGGLSIRWRIGRRGGEGLHRDPPSAHTERFDADRIGETVLLRHWRKGDRFRPIGFGKGIKLQDFFTNQKVPAGRRRNLVVACAQTGEVFWVEGQRISDQFKLLPTTRRCLTWSWAARR